MKEKTTIVKVSLRMCDSSHLNANQVLPSLTSEIR